MVDARRHIPRRSQVPFHVGIVGEKLAIGVEGDVVLVAETTGDEFHTLALRVGFTNVSARREDALGVAVSIPHPGDEMVLAYRDRAAEIEVFREFRMVAVHEVDRLPIRAEDDAVSAMFAAALAFADQLRLVELVVAVSVR